MSTTLRYFRYFLTLSLLSVLFTSVSPQAAQTACDFKDIVQKNLKKNGVRLTDVCPIDRDTSAKRIFSDYGAIFVSENDNPLPPKCIFDDEAEVAAFQSRLKTETQNIAGTTVTLQKSAMESLTLARDEAQKRKLDITPRGGSRAVSYTHLTLPTIYSV